MVGIILASFVFMILFFGLVGAIISSGEKPIDVKSNTLLVIDLDLPIVDRKPNMPFPLDALTGSQQHGLNEIISNIKKAKNDPNIDGIYLKMSMVSSGIATLDEIRDALIDFRESGKFVTTYSEYLSQGAYYLATAGDDIYLNPVGYFNLVGLQAQGVFFSKTLEKLKIEPTILTTGDYKSAGERYVRKSWSDANRQQLNRMINVFWKKIRAQIAGARGVSEELLDEIAKGMLLKEPQNAYDYGLVDSLIYKDQLINILKERTGTEEKDDIRTISLANYSKVPDKKAKGSSKNKIAVVYASGVIVGGNGDDQQVGSEKFSKAIRKARRDSSIKAIVLRINSPGGSSVASEVIYREVMLACQVKPVIISMGDVAASGGYYIACPADTILANPCTITGSIGVIFTYFNTGGLFNWMGVTFDEEKTHPHASFMNPSRSMTKEETLFWQHSINSTYQQFLEHVSEGRNISLEEVKKIAEGRVWAGSDAEMINLIDGYGGLNDAIEIAVEMANVGEKYQVVELPRLPDPLEKLIQDLTNSTQMRLFEKRFGIPVKYLEYLKEMNENQGLLVRMPYLLEVF